MRRCVLHLGMNKTGSTTLQVALRSYDAPGIAWLQTGKTTHTHALVLPFRNPAPDFLYTTQDEAGRVAERAQALDALRAALKATNKSVILSSEFLSDFREAENVRALVEELRQHVDEVNALIYLRDPVGFLSSVYQQSLKQRLPPKGVDGLWPQYQLRIRPWQQVLGRANVIVRPFDPAVFPQGDLLRDFARFAGLDPHTLPRKPKRANESLSAEAVALLYAYRLKHPKPPQDPEARKRDAKLVFALKGFGQERFGFSEKMLEPILARHQSDVAWAEKRQGRAFRKPGGTIGFDTLDALSAYGEQVLPAFKTWAKEALPMVSPTIQSAKSAADALHAIEQSHV